MSFGTAPNLIEQFSDTAEDNTGRSSLPRLTRQRKSLLTYRSRTDRIYCGCGANPAVNLVSHLVYIHDDVFGLRQEKHSGSKLCQITIQISAVAAPGKQTSRK